MLTFTDKAQEVLTTLLDQDGDEEMSLRITSVGSGPMGPRFELARDFSKCWWTNPAGRRWKEPRWTTWNG